MLDIFKFFALLLAVVLFVAWITEKLGLHSKMSSTPQINAGPSADTLQVLETYDYRRFARVFIDCVRNNSASCSLCCPTSLPQNMAPDGQRVLWFFGYPAYQYDFDRTVNYTGNIHDGFKKKRTTMPVSEMSEQLNSVIANYCLENGYPPVKIIHQCDLPNGRVRFTVGPICWGY